jgi:hypothetical protein
VPEKQAHDLIEYFQNQKITPKEVGKTLKSCTAAVQHAPLWRIPPDRPPKTSS